MGQNRNIILASASPRRKELLEKINLKFTVDPSHFPENSLAELKPEGLVKALSLEKACAISQKHPDAIIIAADTIGVLRGKIIGKPHSEEEARKILSKLSGKSHLVITGFTILDTRTKKVKTSIIETRVFFKRLSPMEISSYVKTGEPLDKAGAYAIQGLGSVLVEKIAGDYYNVMGLPLTALVENLKEFGVNVL